MKLWFLEIQNRRFSGQKWQKSTRVNWKFKF